MNSPEVFLFCIMFLSLPTLPDPPQRIVSLVPSVTELLYNLHLEAETAGITKFCVHPETWFRSKPRVGGTKTVHIEKVRALQPDLIIANREENVQEQINTLASEFPVWLTDIHNIPQALQMIDHIGRLTHRDALAEEWIQRIQKEMPSTLPDPIPAVYLIWKDPFMTIGGDTFINDMMRVAGFSNCFKNQIRYPEITDEDIRNSGAQYILLSSEPYPFREKHLAYFRENFPEQQTILADGEYFSWYGSRMALAFPYFRELRAKSGNAI
ncbi:MAG TPA: helical backbone metal receptor [Ferruginibacter sp.]|nr:helical backbone metal receptor [Ferruginibacter sp.]